VPQREPSIQVTSPIASFDRWRVVCQAIGIRNADQEYARLLSAWTSFGRRYHTIDHLAACLLEFDRARHLAQRPAEVEFALWFHDAIYRTYRKDNELRSAEWAARVLAEHGSTAEVITNVREFVMATAHVAATLTGDAALVVDIDLSILGASSTVYDEFERNVRREYWWVPRRGFARARSAILRSFLERPTIYHWPAFQERYEAAARANLGRAIRALQGM
jgi:predicted metal-dependent HD superfamily phosphohydrolase